MGTRGPKSANELATAKPADFQKAKKRPPAPDGLTDAEKEIWRRVVSAMPADWFHREHLDMLKSYCQHAARSDKYNRMASVFEPKDVGDDISLEDLDRVSRMAERESRAALALARSMRLTHQAQLRAETAATKRRSRPDIPDTWNGDQTPPWER